MINDVCTENLKLMHCGTEAVGYKVFMCRIRSAFKVLLCFCLDSDWNGLSTKRFFFIALTNVRQGQITDKDWNL